MNIHRHCIKKKKKAPKGLSFLSSDSADRKVAGGFRLSRVEGQLLVLRLEDKGMS